MSKMFRRSLPEETGSKLAAYFNDLISMAKDGRRLLYHADIIKHRHPKKWEKLDMLYDSIIELALKTLESLPSPAEPPKIPPPSVMVVEGQAAKDFHEGLRELLSQLMTRKLTDRDFFNRLDAVLKVGGLHDVREYWPKGRWEAQFDDKQVFRYPTIEEAEGKLIAEYGANAKLSERLTFIRAAIQS